MTITPQGMISHFLSLSKRTCLMAKAFKKEEKKKKKRDHILQVLLSNFWSLLKANLDIILNPPSLTFSAFFSMLLCPFIIALCYILFLYMFISLIKLCTFECKDMFSLVCFQGLLQNSEHAFIFKYISKMRKSSKSKSYIVFQYQSIIYHGTLNIK